MAAGAVHLRVDSIETALKTSSLAPADVAEAGYTIAYQLARDNLALGHIVVADAVNPIALTRAAWQDVARASNARLFTVEVICSDPAEHRRRVEARAPDIPGLTVPTFADVAARHYEPHPEATLQIDTATLTPDAALATLRAALDR